MRALSAVVVALALVGCVKVDPARRSQLDTWRASLQPKSLSYPSAQGSRTAIAEGQWVEYLAVDENGDPAKVRYSVFGEEDEGRWLEVDRTDYYSHTIVRLLVVTSDWNNPLAWTIKRIVSQRNDETPEELSPSAVGAAADHQLGALRTQLKTAGAERETITVPAGIFHDTLRIRSKTETSIGSFESTIWLHNVVPVTGWARAKSRDGKLTMEVTEFGLTGAVSGMAESVLTM